jgi:alkylation response protein AidB-like acyl-CoA dehydrogenase
MYRDSRAGALAGGASDVMRDIVAQQIIDLSRQMRE